MTMFDDDPGVWTPIVWSDDPPPLVPQFDDDLTFVVLPAQSVDSDPCRPPNRWDEDWHPWNRPYLPNVDHGVVLGISGLGTAGAATLIPALEPGFRVTFSWATSIVRSYSGKEHRESPFGQPRRSFDGVAFLLDAGSRDTRSMLMRAAAAGSTFLLALPFEELTISADSTGNVVTVSTTALSDWARTTQRIVVVGRDGSTAGGVVQIVTATTIQVRLVDADGALTAAALGNIGLAGGRIMPAVQVLLEPQQGFARYPATVDLWSLRARAQVFGFAGVDAMGIGATLTTFSDGPVPAADVTDADLLVWDRTNEIEGTANESLLSGAEIVDLGALPFGAGAIDAPEWGRSIKYRSSSPAEWQWFKAFVRRTRGRQRVFALPTGRDDLLYVATVAGGIKVVSGDVAGAGDYESWFASQAHRRLAITVNGVVQYFEVTEVTDNLDGTLTLTLDLNVSGTVTKVSLLEHVRFERDDIEATWDGGAFSVDEVVRVASDAVEVPARFVFDRVLNLHFAYTGIFPDLPPADQQFVVSLGTTTLINWTSDRSLTFGGIAPTAGPIDGQILVVSNVNTASFSLILPHEDTAWPTQNRMRNAGLTTVTGAGRATWYRYTSIVNRWIQLV